MEGEFLPWVFGVPLFNPAFGQFPRIFKGLFSSNPVICAAANAGAFFAFGVIAFGVTTANTTIRVVDGN